MLYHPNHQVLSSTSGISFGGSNGGLNNFDSYINSQLLATCPLTLISKS